MASQKKDELVSRATKAFVSEISAFYSGRGKGSNYFDQYPNYDLNRVIQMIREDSVVWSGATTLLDRIMEAGWEIQDERSGSRLKAVERMLGRKGFNQWLREIVLHYIFFQNAFGELVMTDAGTVKELHTLDPLKTQPRVDQHGTVLEYFQVITGSAGNSEMVRWQPEEVLHFADPSLNMNVWGEVSIKTIYQAVQIKKVIKNFMHWLFATNQFRGVYNIKGGADEDTVKQFMAGLKEGENHLDKPVVIMGDVEHGLQRDLKDISVLKDLIYKMDEDILNFLQVPPIYAGLPDNSNRSNSDAQERALNTRVHSIMKLLEGPLNKLLQRMRIFNARFTFRPLDTLLESQALDNAIKLKQLGVSGSFLAEYLREKGMDVPESEKFDADVQYNEKFAPSRMRKSAGVGNEQIGTGQRGTTRPEQLTKRLWSYDAIQE